MLMVTELVCHHDRHKTKSEASFSLEKNIFRSIQKLERSIFSVIRTYL